jgi:hypothetical protein
MKKFTWKTTCICHIFQFFISTQEVALWFQVGSLGPWYAKIESSFLRMGFKCVKLITTCLFSTPKVTP